MKHQTLFNATLNPTKSEPLIVTQVELADEMHLGDGQSRYIEDLNSLLADVFTLHLKTKNYHWHMTGKMFYVWHEMLDQHAKELYDITDDIAERVRKMGGQTIRSIEDIQKQSNLNDSNEKDLSALEMLSRLRVDHQHLIETLKRLRKESDGHDDPATGAMIDVWLDQAEKRFWFLDSTLKEQTA